MKNFFADDRTVRALGRTLFRDNTRYLSWSCSGIEFMFTGRELSAELWTDWTLDEPWKGIFQGYMAVFVNDEETPRKRFAVGSGTSEYEIYRSDSAETVKIRIVKLSESAFDKIGIKSISADGEISPTEPREMKIEFVGDSITCSFGIEGKDETEGFRTETENPCINYAALTARRFGADFNLISWSSIGVYSSSTSDGNINDGWVMPMLYDYTDIGIEGTLGIEEHIPWEFEKFRPDVIVVNLGTNDATYTKDIPERLRGFEKAYKDFIGNIRKKNPDPYIICVLGMMGDELFPDIENAVRELGDSRIFAVRLDVQKPEDGIGSEKHPNFVTHRKAAEKLSAKIAEITGRRPIL